MATALRDIIDKAIGDFKTTLNGKVISGFYRLYDTDGNWCWVADVHIGDGKILKSVPVSSNNVDIIYSQQNKGVVLTKIANNRWIISGITKVIVDDIHYTYVTFQDDIFFIVSDETVGVRVRPLTYGELGAFIVPYGYGILPYGIQGKFNPDGTLIEIVEWY